MKPLLESADHEEEEEGNIQCDARPGRGLPSSLSSSQFHSIISVTKTDQIPSKAGLSGAASKPPSLLVPVNLRFLQLDDAVKSWL